MSGVVAPVRGGALQEGALDSESFTVTVSLT